MRILRTPDIRFRDLEGYPFEPHYTTIRLDDGGELRIHHLDEGPRDGPAVLCMHGQPAWSYLYRKMIPPLTAAGLRVIAPDLPGFGKSDKPAAREDYTYQSQVDWMNAWLSANDFTGLTFFGQDWGGAIGLRLVADQPGRFDRVVISNTGLPLPADTPDEVIAEVEAFRADPHVPSLIEMGRALADMGGASRQLKFAYWQKFCWGTVDLPVGLLMYMGATKDSRLSNAIQLGLRRLGLGKIARSALVKAYDAPFPDPSFKMGPRAMPSRVPTLPTDPSMEAQRRAWAALRTFEKPFLCAFSDGDPITRGGDAAFIEQVPGAKGQPHRVIPGAGHFIQEGAPEAVAQTIIDFVDATKSHVVTPTAPPNKDAVKRKYAQERAKRLRPDGNAQYQRLEDKFSDLATDPYTPLKPRDPVSDHVTFAFLGAGFSGLVVGARLKEAGIDDVRLIDKGGDVGGTWYWNRYPGVRCDTAAMIYLPLLEETGYMPSEKYVRGSEIREHCVRIANQYGLYDKALFHTEVNTIEWQEQERVWRIKTSRGDDFTAKYVGIGAGPLHVAKLPGIPGIENFRGKAFHTSRWDYDYTGGDAHGAPMAKLVDKRVAIIGTGATGVQCIPPLASSAQELFVFQRTPSSVDERHNHEIDPEWFASIATPGWQKRWLDNFVENQGRGIPTEDLIDDGWTEIARRIREKVFSLPPDQINPESIRLAFEDADIEKMEQIRARVDSVVADPDTAAKLKAWYSQLCKRPCFSDEYLPAFNAPNTTLVDTDGKGVEMITQTGLVANGEHYEVDCIIFASGFEFGANFQLKSGFDLKGRGGQPLSEHWKHGMRTLHGLHVHGFPNAFMVQMNQGANMVSNIPHNIVDHARTVAQVVSHAEAGGFAEVEPSVEAVAAWVELILTGEGSLFASPECTPGFWNNEGQGWTQELRQSQGHPGGPQSFFEHMSDWREAGDFKGLRFT